MFREGDIVQHRPSGFYGTVGRVYANNYVDVIFTDKNIAPPVMKLPTYELYLISENKARPSPNKCPKCGGNWTETYIQYEPKYDCLKCNIKKEDVDGTKEAG